MALGSIAVRYSCSGVSQHVLDVGRERRIGINILADLRRRDAEAHRKPEDIDRLLAGMCTAKPDTPRLVVVSMQVDYNHLLQRLTGRRTCPTCGRIYNVFFQPPRVDELCDVDGSKLVARKDDSEAVISERLKAYEKQTLPLTDYYRRAGVLRSVNGDQPVEQVTAAVFGAIEHDRL